MSKPSYATTLGGQFRTHAIPYVSGALCLLVFQTAMNRIDWRTKHIVDSLEALSQAKQAPQQVDLLAALTHGPLTGDLVLLLGFALVALLVRVLSRVFIFNAGRQAEFELRAEILAHLHRLGAAYFRRTSVGEIMSRATNDLLQVRLLLGFGVLNIVNVLLAFVSALQVMLQVSVRLTVVAFVMLPMIVLVTRGFSKRLFSATKQNQESLGKLTDRVQSSLAGVRVVRSFGLEALQEERFAEANRVYLQDSLRLARLRGVLGPIAGTASAAGVLAFFWYGSSLLALGEHAGGISKGGFFAFWMSLGRLTWPIIALGFSVAIIQRGRAGMARLAELFAEKPEIEDGEAKLKGECSGKLSVRGLSYAQAGKQILSEVSFELPASGSIAIMGRTGAGKTTLGALLARLLPTPKATVLLDDQDVCELPAQWVRRQVGYAPQESFLFSTTVETNIAFGVDAATHERVVEAASDAQVHNEILEMPDKFDTVVGERGVQLSGGQKQRVALARALLVEPKILVLDDPMSAVDAKTESLILRAIEKQRARRTLVLITHRVRAAQLCDQILVLDQGKVVEFGTDAELRAMGGIYASFAAEQERDENADKNADKGAAA
jgi:ATP-binding cassette, subfamily B, multidrug efflux pump